MLMNTKTAAIESTGTDEALERSCCSKVVGILPLCVGHCSMAKFCVAAGFHDYILNKGFRKMQNFSAS